MRVYYVTANAETILDQGFRDPTGVWVADRPVRPEHDNDASAVLALDIPEELFQQFEWGDPDIAYREAHIPSEDLNRHGPPMVLDHPYAGRAREDLLAEADSWETAGQRYDAPGFLEKAVEIRRAVALFDRFGYPPGGNSNGSLAEVPGAHA
jgi:hypothetical protein